MCQLLLGETTAVKIYRKRRDQVGSKKLPSYLTGHLSIRNYSNRHQQHTSVHLVELLQLHTKMEVEHRQGQLQEETAPV